MNITYLSTLFVFINIIASYQKYPSRKRKMNMLGLLEQIKKEVADQYSFHSSENDSWSLPFNCFQNYRSNKGPAFKRYQGLLRDGTTPAIASIVLPPIQPVLDIITAASNSITTQITALFNTALANVQTAINTSSSTVVPDVVTAITTGNASLSQGISATFVTTLANIASDISTITSTANTGTTGNINTAVTALLQSISDRLTTADNAVDAAIAAGAAQNINLVIAAVTNANNDVYTQLVTALNDPTNVTAIFPTLVYADPNAIANLLVGDNNALYTTIGNLINGALADINQYIITANANEINAETTILNNASAAILASLNTNVNSFLLPTVQQTISTVTASEVTALNSILNTNNDTLATAIHAIVDSLNPQVITIVNTVTAQEISDMTTLITSDLAGVTSQVSAILAV